MRVLLVFKSPLYTYGIVPCKFNAITIGDTIHFSPRADRIAIETWLDPITQNPHPLLNHEMVHIRQQRDAGVVGFGLNYIKQYAKLLLKGRSADDAYHGIDAEKEAYARKEPSYRIVKKMKSTPEFIELDVELLA